MCRGVVAYYSAGEHVVTPRIAYGSASATATFTAVNGTNYPLQFMPASGLEPYVFGYGALRVWAYGPVAGSPGFARIWLRDDPGYSWTVTVPATTPDMVDPLEIYVGGLAPGRYRITPCVGDSPETCEEVPGGVTFQVGTGKLEELIPGWNRRDADRINVVFAASGAVTVEAARATARDLLGWDGPLLVADDDTLLPATASPSEVWSVVWGPFAIEPLRSARDRFNLWFLEDVVDDPYALQYSAPPYGTGPPPDFALPDLQVTRLHFLPAGRFSRSDAGFPSFTSPGGPTVVTRVGLDFAGAYVALPAGSARLQAAILAHEWGHALFDLRDEYQEPGRSVTYGYPNCAPDRAAAESWWGDQLGEVDPFVDEFVAVSTRWSQWVDPDLVTNIAVGYFGGGCYEGGTDEVVRPTGDSIMNSGVPVFGSVNRRRAEEVLSLWTGLSPLTAETVSASCDPVGWGERLARCRLAVEPNVDVPRGTVLASSGGAVVDCVIPPGAADDTTDFVCEPVPLSGPGPWRVAFAGESGDRVDDLVIPAPPPPLPEPQVLPEPPPIAPLDAAESHVGAWWVIGGLVAVIVGSAGVLIRRRFGPGATAGLR